MYVQKIPNYGPNYMGGPHMTTQLTKTSQTKIFPPGGIHPENWAKKLLKDIDPRLYITSFRPLFGRVVGGILLINNTYDT